MKINIILFVFLSMVLSLSRSAWSMEKEHHEEERVPVKKQPHGAELILEEEIEASLQQLATKVLEEDAEAKYRLGVYYSSVRNGAVKAVDWFQQAAETQDHPEALYMLSSHYFIGAGVGPDTEEGMRLLRRAARRGSAKAQVELGNDYYNGSPIRQNLKKAKKWLQLALDQGDDSAIDCLANMYAKGEGVKKDERKVAELYQRARTREGAYEASVILPYAGTNFFNVMRRQQLASLYQKGLSVPHDEAKWAQLMGGN